MIRIHAPHQIEGRSTFLDVEFVDGVATVDELHPLRERALTQHGYRVDHELDVPRGADESTPVFDLEQLTVAQLRDYADSQRIDLPASARRKPEIIAAIASAPSADEADEEQATVDETQAPTAETAPGPTDG